MKEHGDDDGEFNLEEDNDEVLSSGDEEGHDASDCASAKNEVEEEEDHDSDVGDASDLSHSDAEDEGDDFIEVVMQDGTIEKVMKPEGIEEATAQDEFEKAIQDDPIYDMLHNRRRQRMSIVIITGVCIRIGNAHFAAANSLFKM